MKIYLVGATFNGPITYGYIVNEIGESGNIDIESEVLLSVLMLFIMKDFLMIFWKKLA